MLATLYFMRNSFLKYFQWLLVLVCVSAGLTFIYIINNVPYGENSLIDSKGIWGIFGVSLMGLVVVLAYRDYLAGKGGLLTTMFQITISFAAMAGVTYLVNFVIV